jgi:hypothetical protein
MHSVLHKIFFSFLLATAGFCAHAQIKFSASASPNVIGKDEYTQLTLTVENAREAQIVPPSLRDFIILSGPSDMTSMSMVNGVTKSSRSLVFVIKPKAIGVFTIPGAMAKADGGDYKSNSVTIKVQAKPTGSSPNTNQLNSAFGNMDPFEDAAPPRSSYNDYILRKGENPADKIKKNMFVRLEVDKKSCFVGEPIVASYKLYTRLQSESNMTKNPSFNGFSVLDMTQPNDMSYRVEKFGGREYNVYTLRKVQLYPLLAGELELGVVEIENNVHFIKAEYANQRQDLISQMFRDFSNSAIPAEGMENQKVTLQSQPITISVKALPDASKPADFKGAVGHFTVDAKIEKDNFTTDDAGKIAIMISGEGNLQMINAPEVKWPEGIEGFDSKATDDLFKGAVPVSGRKIFEFPFTVSKPGSYTLPAVIFSYFDNREGKYKTVTTTPVDINVTKGTGKPKRADAAPVGNAPENIFAQFFSNRLRVVSAIAVFIIIGLIVWLKRDSRADKKTKALKESDEILLEEKPVEEIIQQQTNPLAVSEECLQREDGKLFYSNLNLELKNYLSQKFNIPAEELNHKNIASQLDAKGVSNETSIQLQQLIGDIEWQLYTPVVESEKMHGMYIRANELIQLLNTYRS